MKIDKTDQSILNALMRDSRQSYRQLAKKVRVSVATIANRMEKLRNEGVIKKHSAVVDFTKLGYDFQVLVEVRVAHGKLFEVEKKIALHPNVYGVYDVTGDFDAMVLARFKNRKGLDGFVKKMQTFDFVERTQTKLVLNTIKEDQINL